MGWVRIFGASLVVSFICWSEVHADGKASLLTEVEILKEGSPVRSLEIYWSGQIERSEQQALTTALHDYDRGYDIIDTYTVWRKEPETGRFLRGLAKFRFWGESSLFGWTVKKRRWVSVTLLLPGLSGQEDGILVHTGAVYGGPAIGWLIGRPWETFSMDIDLRIVEQALEVGELPSIWMESFYSEQPFWRFYWAAVGIDPKEFDLPEFPLTSQQQQLLLKTGRGPLHRGPLLEDEFVEQHFYPVTKEVVIP